MFIGEKRLTKFPDINIMMNGWRDLREGKQSPIKETNLEYLEKKLKNLGENSIEYYDKFLMKIIFQYIQQTEEVKKTLKNYLLSIVYGDDNKSIDYDAEYASGQCNVAEAILNKLTFREEKND